jgi:hypothetical protein
MLLVLVFIALSFSFFAVAHHQMDAALRLETVRVHQDGRDAGSVHAVARGLTLLETGLPPTDPYVCGVTIGTPPDDQQYTVTFSSAGGNVWSVQAAPTVWPDDPPAMPALFTTP